MEINLTPKQSKAWLDYLENPRTRRVLFDGAGRSGKTQVILAWLIKEAQRYQGCRILIARQRFNHAKTTLWPSLLKVVPDYAQVYESDLEVWIGESVIRVGGLDDKERVDKILGDEYLHAFINEATQVSWETVTTVITRLAQSARDEEGREAVRKLILDCNPKGPRHWIHRVAIQKIYPDTLLTLRDADAWGRLNWTVYDNASNLPADYFESLDALPEIKRMRMKDGIWCDNEGSVYSEFDEEIHVVDDMPLGWADWKKVRGVDFGYTNPFACIFGAVDPDGRLYLYDEIYKTKVLVSDHAVEIRRRGNSLWTVADHDAEDRATLHKAGVYTEAAKKSIQPGIEAVKKRLMVQKDGRPRIFFLRRGVPCTINEMYAYVWPEGVDGKTSKEDPVDANNHALDAVRYMVAKLDGLAGAPSLAFA